MPFAIRYRKVGRSEAQASETLAVDIASRDEAGAIVERLARSYSQNGRHSAPIRWFRNGAGLHQIWAQPQ